MTRYQTSSRLNANWVSEPDVTYTGVHEPLVSRLCWQRVQEILNARAKDKKRKVKHYFAYTGLVRCGHCGCLMVGELKSLYVYYLRVREDTGRVGKVMLDCGR